MGERLKNHMKYNLEGENNMKILLQILVTCLIATVAFSQTAPTTTSTKLVESVSKPAPFKITAGLKSYTDSGRVSALQSDTLRTLKSKNKIQLGLKLSSGWGLQAQFVSKAEAYGAQSKTRERVIPDDWSLTLAHPIYKNDNLSLTGSLREYFPVNNFSVNRGLYQKAYYLNLNYKMAADWVFFNQTINRYFVQNYYKPTDTRWVIEDYTTISRNTNDWLRIGLGQRTQVEFHSETPTGNCVEVYPYVDFMLGKNFFAGPRIFLPVAVQNSIYEGPTSVSVQNIYGEFYIQATL